MDVKNGKLILEDDDRRKYFGYLDKRVKYPDKIEKMILEVILERHGIKYTKKGKTLEELFDLIPERIVETYVDIINKLYLEEEKVDYSEIEEAYLIYYLPINTFKIHRLLSDLAINNLLKTEVDIIDIGCGPGSASVGILLFYNIIAKNLPDINFNISITLLDAQHQFLAIAQQIIYKVVGKLPENLTVTIEEPINCDIGKDFRLDYFYDYIVISNVLNGNETDENFRGKAFFTELKDSLVDDGAILIIEPGDMKQCKRLKLLRNNILNKIEGINLYGPCYDIWGTEKSYDCACFSHAHVKWERPYLIQKLINLGLQKKVQKIPFNYLILRSDNQTKYSPKKYPNTIQLKDISKSIDKSVNVVGIVRCVMEQGNYLWVSICDGSIKLDENKHIYLSISIYDSEMMKKYGGLLSNMNVGERIEASNVRCERMWKYPGSYLLHIDKSSEVIGFY